MTDVILRSDKDGVATLTLNRSDKLNSLTVQMFVDLRVHIDDIATKPDEIGCVVLRGAGRSFCAGNDLKDLGAGTVRPPRPNFQGLTIEALSHLPQPVIAAVHGHCFTGGLELALAADIIFANENTRFADTHGKWGIIPAWGLSARLPRRVGLSKAKEMSLTGRTYSAADAHAMGLVNICVADDAFEAELSTLTRDITANSWHSNRGYKRLYDEADNLSLEVGLAQEIFRSPGRAKNAMDLIAGFGKKD